MKLTYVTDPSHGWLVVTIGQLADVGLGPEAFSRYSYRQGDQLALEEDRDAQIYLDAHETTYKTTPLVHATHEDHGSEIRSWSRL